MITCTFEDGHRAYFRHATVDTLVIKDNQILLVKRSNKVKESGKWSLTGGYLDRDETLAEGAAREVYEESGWKIEGLTLLAIRDNIVERNEDNQNVKFIYFAKAVEQTGSPDDETDEVRWWPLDQLPPIEQIAFDHLDSINLYKKYLIKNLSLPLINS